MKQIVIMESLGVSQEELDKRKAPFEKEGCLFTQYEKTADIAEMTQRAKEADVMILANMPMPSEVIAACTKLRFIDVAFTGVDHIGLDAAREKGIVVSNASGYSNQSVAELAIGMCLSILRNLSAVEKRCREGGTKEGLVGSELKGKTVGILGLGQIGTRSAALFHAFGCRILANSRRIHSDAPEYVDQVDFDTLLQESDILVLHCPLNDSTRGIINKDALSKMKPTGILINVARGPVVAANDLKEALEKGIIAGAGVDVFDAEPPLSPEEPLLHAKNCLVTPHIAFATKESMLLRADIVFDNLRAWLSGQPINRVLD